jgi:hypothetical protein
MLLIGIIQTELLKVDTGLNYIMRSIPLPIKLLQRLVAVQCVVVNITTDYNTKKKLSANWIWHL